jgi:hypothetical protein
LRLQAANLISLAVSRIVRQFRLTFSCVLVNQFDLAL